MTDLENGQPRGWLAAVYVLLLVLAAEIFLVVVPPASIPISSIDREHDRYAGDVVVIAGIASVPSHRYGPGVRVAPYYTVEDDAGVYVHVWAPFEELPESGAAVTAKVWVTRGKLDSFDGLSHVEVVEFARVRRG
jgi:hypothetical protein